MKKYLGYLRKFLISFASVFTCVILASTIFIWLFSNPYLPFRLILQAAILAAVSSLLYFLFYSEHPISKRSMIFRTLLHFTLLLITVTACAWLFKWFDFGKTGLTLVFFGLFDAAYSILWLANFLGDIMDEKIMNLRLAEYKAGRK